MAAERSRLFADLLRDARRAAGLTQEELAERAGLSVQALSKLESEVSQSPRRDTLALLVAALGPGETERAAFAQAARRQLSHAGCQPLAPITGAADLPLIGRTREMLRLAYHLAGACPPVLLLAGEPGIGKTRLLRVAAMRAGMCGWRVLGALARYMHQQSSARLRAELTGCSWLVRLLPELAETSLVPVPAWTLPADQERHLMFAAVRRFLANIAGPAGTVLVLDDLHWAGADAFDLLAMLLRSEPDQPLQVIGAYRSTEVRPEHALAATLAKFACDGRAEQIVLDPLDAREAAALLDSLLEGAGGSRLGGRNGCCAGRAECRTTW